jgi:signal transduction histidine kinase
MKGRTKGIPAGVDRAKTLSWHFMIRNSAGLLLVLVFAVEVGLAVFVIRDLLTTYNQVERVYLGSVQGLRSIGELQYETQETRRSTLYALTTDDGNLQVQYADQSRAADQRASDGIVQYLALARMPREKEIGQRLADDWKAYLKVRDFVLGLILENSPKEAVAIDLASGVPLFDRVRQDLEEVKVLYDQQASQQLALVTKSSRKSVLKLIGGFVFALFFGSAAVWAIQTNKMRSEMRLAKMQMDFVASISHELRTPITAILWAGENVKDGFASGKDDLAEQGSIIVEHATYLAALVDQVLLFAATSTKPRYPLRPLQVSEIIQHALRNTSVLLLKSNSTIDQQMQEGLPRVAGDFYAVSQCLQNLLVNAVKYSVGESQIGLSARLDESSADRREVCISVRDQGPGISGSDLPRIFEPFYRSPGVVSAQIHGTGLGLSIAKSMIEAMGGKLSVVTELGGGSTFTLHLRAVEEQPHSQNHAESSAPGSLRHEGEHTASG